MKDEVSGLKGMIKNLKEQIKLAQSEGDEIRLADLRSVYQNTMAEKERVKQQKKFAKSLIK